MSGAPLSSSGFEEALQKLPEGINEKLHQNKHAKIIGNRKINEN